MSPRPILVSTCLTALLIPISVAQAEEKSSNGWVGEGSFSAANSTGNTDTTDLGLSLKLDRKSGAWTAGFNASGDYGETDGDATKNRFLFGAHLDRQINDKLFAFGAASYEDDEFSGFSSRIFVGGGLGYEILGSNRLNWNVRGGPGIKIDEIEPIFDTSVDPAILLEPARTEESVSTTMDSNFRFDLNEHVALTNDSKVLWADESTQIGNISAVKSTLTDALSLRLSFEVRHDTNPPRGFESTDTISRIALVYGIGK